MAKQQTTSKRTQDSQPDKLKEAAALLQAEKDARAAAFIAELQELCKKHNCDIIPTFQIKAN